MADGQVVSAVPQEWLDKVSRLAPRQPATEEIPWGLDSRPIQTVGQPKVVQTPSGGMVVWDRKVDIMLYRADGTEAPVPLDRVGHYLRKRDDDGKPIFFQNPPAEVPKPTVVCRYCFLKIRSSTLLEVANNSENARLNDPEVQELLAGLGDDGKSGAFTAEDAEYKLAEHIRKKHRGVAAFRGDPLYERAVEADARSGNRR